MDPRALLKRELARRCDQNSRYSMRAFAKALGLSHTVLSLVLSGKRPLSKKALSQVSQKLGLDPEHQSLLEMNRKGRVNGAVLKSRHRQLSLDEFSVVSDWYHFAILSLLETPRARFEAKWIARRLAISETQALLAMERLERTGLVARGPGGRWKQTGHPIQMRNSESTAATRKFHLQLMQLAAHSIENDPPEKRDCSSMTIAIDPALIPYASERIRQFRRELAEELESKASPKEVYQLAVQIFPVSKNVEQ